MHFFGINWWIKYALPWTNLLLVCLGMNIGAQCDTRWEGSENSNDGALEIVDSRQQGNNMWCLVCWLGRSGALACLDSLAETGLTSSRHAFLLFSLKMKETIEQSSQIKDKRHCCRVTESDPSMFVHPQAQQAAHMLTCKVYPSINYFHFNM